MSEKKSLQPHVSGNNKRTVNNWKKSQAQTKVMRKLFLYALLTLGTFIQHHSSATTYYVSSVSGDNSNSGTSTLAPFQSIDKLSTLTFSPGDTIMFKAGETFTGHAWQITSAGTSSTTGLITVTSYGSGNKPILDGTGMPISEYTTTVITTATTSGTQSISCLINIASNVNYWKFSNLSFRNCDVGVHCYHPSTVTSTQNYFQIYGCNFSYCNILGVRFYAESSRKINDVTVSHCNLSKSYSGVKLCRCYNSTITDSSLSEMDGGAISITDTTDGGLIFNCDIWRAGKAYKASGQCAVYLANVRDLDIDSCSIAYTYRSPNPADPTKLSPDGVAIDFESANQNITVSNCELHDNDGAACLVYRNPSWGFENRPLNFIGNTIYGNGLKGGSGGTPGGAQFMRHLQDQVSGPGEYSERDPGYGGIISGNIVTLSNNTSCYLVQTHSSSLTDTAPAWYSLAAP